MILYEFHCDTCNKNFEFFSNMGTKQVRCPTCDIVANKIFSPIRLLEKMIPPTSNQINSGNTIVRIPEYKDRNTGESFMGDPEVKTISKEV